MPTLNNDRSTQRPRRAERPPPDTTAREASRHLSAVDPRLAEIIARVGVHRPVIEPRPFIALIESITQQQVSMRAAAAIFARLKRACPRGRLTPQALLDLDASALRGIGLSRQKAQYVRNVADAFAGGRLSAAKLRRMSDDEVLTEVSKIKGVGRWTVEMLLIFSLGRPDVWPIDDLGLRRAVQRFLELSAPPGADQMRKLGQRWRPYRTYAAWYLWRFSEGNGQPGVALPNRERSR
jgi:DNA-3-methyladenine glycosylase II